MIQPLTCLTWLRLILNKTTGHISIISIFGRVSRGFKQTLQGNGMSREEFLQTTKRLRKKYRHIEADINDLADRLEAGATPDARN
jgi:hypothetical protein